MIRKPGDTRRMPGGTFHVPSGQVSERSSMHLAPPSQRMTLYQQSSYRPVMTEEAPQHGRTTTESDTMSMGTVSRAGGTYAQIPNETSGGASTSSK